MKGRNQEMHLNQTPNSTELAIPIIALFLFGIGYNILVERFQKRTQRFTAEMVVGGVLVTVTTSGFFIGWNNAGVVLLFFVASGLPMLIGSWLRSARDDEEAKRIAKDSLK